MNLPISNILYPTHKRKLLFYLFDIGDISTHWYSDLIYIARPVEIIITHSPPSILMKIFVCDSQFIKLNKMFLWNVATHYTIIYLCCIHNTHLDVYVYYTQHGTYCFLTCKYNSYNFMKNVAVIFNATFILYFSMLKKFSCDHC